MKCRCGQFDMCDDDFITYGSVLHTEVFCGTKSEWISRVKDVTTERDALRARAEAGYQLSTWAATINWKPGDNQPEWLDGLRERIEKVQALKEGE